MALRILLADESATIKKVIELSLQDFSVDLKTVNLGVDVLDVARKFQPDIIFVDILLQKKNGYEVCNDLKNDEDTKNIPVIILWSGFMDLDQQKLQVVGADRTLEKPFDSDAIRNLVEELVPERGEVNPLMEHVDVPDIPAPGDFTQVRSLDEINRRLSANEDSQFSEEEEMDDVPASPIAPSAPLSPETPEKDAGNWNMDSFDSLPELELPEDFDSEPEEEMEEDDFSHFELKTPSSQNEAPVDSLVELAEEDDEGEWQNQSLGKFKLDLPEHDDNMEELGNLEIAQDVEVPENTVEFLWTPEEETELQREEPENTPTPISLEGNDQVEASAELNIPTKEEIDQAPEIELGADSFEMEIENNEDLGIETISAEPISGHEKSLKADHSEVIQDFLRSDDFRIMLGNLLEEKLQKAVERAIPEMAKSAIEKEIKRLLDEPF